MKHPLYHSSFHIIFPGNIWESTQFGTPQRGATWVSQIWARWPQNLLAGPILNIVILFRQDVYCRPTGRVGIGTVPLGGRGANPAFSLYENNSITVVTPWFIEQKRRQTVRKCFKAHYKWYPFTIRQIWTSQLWRFRVLAFIQSYKLPLVSFKTTNVHFPIYFKAIQFVLFL